MTILLELCQVSCPFPAHKALILLFHSCSDGPPVTLCSFMVFACLICNHSALNPSCQSPTAIKTLCTIFMIGIFELHK